MELAGTGEKLQAYHLQVGNFFGQAKDRERLATWYRKAHDAAPDTRQGQGVKKWMQQKGLWKD